MDWVGQSPKSRRSMIVVLSGGLARVNEPFDCGIFMPHIFSPTQWHVGGLLASRIIGDTPWQPKYGATCELHICLCGIIWVSWCLGNEECTSWELSGHLCNKGKLDSSISHNHLGKSLCLILFGWVSLTLEFLVDVIHARISIVERIYEFAHYYLRSINGWHSEPIVWLMNGGFFMSFLGSRY